MSSTADHLARIARDGYTIVPDVLSSEEADNIATELERLESELAVKPSSNMFEGKNTLRIYNLLVHGALFQRIPVNDRVLPVVKGVLDAGCLVSSLSSIAILPGETAQPIHADDMLIPLPKPHVALVCNSMWAITDFTEANGATRIVPGTHNAAESPSFSDSHDSVPAVMSKGSVMVYHGSLWHGGGANTADQRRVGIAMNYCAGYVRQQENQQLGIPRHTARTFEPRLRELIGYSVYNRVIGHINRKHPGELLDNDDNLDCDKPHS